MTDFTNDGIDELDRLASASDNVFQMSRGGYVLATRQSDIAHLVNAIQGDIDIDVIAEHDAIRKRFPSLSTAIRNVIHIRRGGDISGQQLGQYLMERTRAAGGRKLQGHVTGIHDGTRYRLDVRTRDGEQVV